jgi:rhodanese-related sulfurtransferase
MIRKRWVVALLTGVLALGLVASPAFAATAAIAKRPVTHARFDARAGMIVAADAYFKNAPSPVIAAADLYTIVQAKDAAYQIVDVRSASDYTLGHIDGAINIPFAKTADNASLALLDSTKTIVVVCYTGEGASMVTQVWVMLGYHATALMYGMSGWVADKAIVGMDIWNGVGAGYPTVTYVPKATRTFHAAKVKARYANVTDAIKGQARAYFAKGLAPVITAADVRKIVLSHDPRYQIVSVEQTADYAKGHIKGAMNIVWTDIADKTAKLDPHKTIIVYCYSGQTGAQASMFLNLMGYRAYNILSGMSSWNNDPTVGGFSFYNPATVGDCPTVK